MKIWVIFGTDMNHSPINDLVKTWVKQYSGELYSWAFYKTSDKELSEDIVQDTFVAAFKGFKEFKGESEVKTWLYGILKNKIADHYRKQQRRSTVKLDTTSDYFVNGHWKESESPKEWAVTDEKHLLDDLKFKSVLDGCINKLPGNWSAIIRLKFIDDKESKIVCQELEITPTNYWQIIHRAKLQLRKCLELNWFAA